MDMAELSRKLDECAALLEGDVVYLDFPVHGNVGDLLIWLGAQKLMKRNNIRVKGQYGQSIGSRALAAMARCATICLHGGGNFGDLYPRHQFFREKIIEKYPDKKIVIFPQSVFFEDESEFDRACQILAGHKNLHICLRDRKSFTLLAQKGIANLHLMPDTAHALWPVQETARAGKSDKLYFFRRDKENSAIPDDFAAEQGASFDWDELVRGTGRLSYFLSLYLHKIEGRITGNLSPSYPVWKWQADRLCAAAVALFPDMKRL